MRSLAVHYWNLLKFIVILCQPYSPILHVSCILQTFDYLNAQFWPRGVLMSTLFDVVLANYPVHGTELQVLDPTTSSVLAGSNTRGGRWASYSGSSQLFCGKTNFTTFYRCQGVRISLTGESKWWGCMLIEKASWRWISINTLSQVLWSLDWHFICEGGVFGGGGHRSWAYPGILCSGCSWTSKKRPGHVAPGNLSFPDSQFTWI